MIEIRNVLLLAAVGLSTSLSAPRLLAQQTAPEAKPPAAARQPATPEVKKGVDALIRDLGSDSYRDRIDAERQLRELGEAAVPALKAAAEQKNDAEVQWRARRVLRQIEQGSQPLTARGRGGREQEPERVEVEISERAGERTRGSRGLPDDDVRRQFESLFERFERDFGLDVPRARFFDDGFFPGPAAAVAAGGRCVAGHECADRPGRLGARRGAAEERPRGAGDQDLRCSRPRDPAA